MYRIHDRLSQSFLFMGLDESDMTVVINAMDEKKANAGDTIITEGEKGDVLYVVEDGLLECYKNLVILIQISLTKYSKVRKSC